MGGAPTMPPCPANLAEFEISVKLGNGRALCARMSTHRELAPSLCTLKIRFLTTAAHFINFLGTRARAPQIRFVLLIFLIDRTQQNGKPEPKIGPAKGTPFLGDKIATVSSEIASWISCPQKSAFRERGAANYGKRKHFTREWSHTGSWHPFFAPELRF